MSPDDYHDYYWPPLKRLLDELIQNGITPMVMCEGSYYTRLEVLKEIQKGKVVYFFEKQDMKKAKEILGGTACIAGNFDTGLLMHGTKAVSYTHLNQRKNQYRKKRMQKYLNLRSLIFPVLRTI